MKSCLSSLWDCWVLKDYLEHVWLVVFKFILRCSEVNVTKAMTICEGLISLQSTNACNIRIESDCLELVHLLKRISLDLYEVSLFIEEAKLFAHELGDVSFFPCEAKIIIFTLSFEMKALAMHDSILLLVWYTCICVVCLIYIGNMKIIFRIAWIDDLFLYYVFFNTFFIPWLIIKVIILRELKGQLNVSFGHLLCLIFSWS